MQQNEIPTPFKSSRTILKVRKDAKKIKGAKIQFFKEILLCFFILHVEALNF